MLTNYIAFHLRRLVFIRVSSPFIV